MPDEFDIVHLGHDETQEIIDWAVRTAAMVTLMHASPGATTPVEQAERLEGFAEAVQIMFDEIPRPLIGPALNLAEEVVEDAAYTEAEIEKFKAELDEL